MTRNTQIPTRIFATVIAITILLSVAFLQRILPITGWNAFPGSYTVEGEAILTNVDGYYYLNAAKEILEGNYSTTETHRAIPDTISRSPLPPLLSVLTAAIARISGISVNWVGAMLPAILSLSIAVPIFFFGWRYGGAIAAVAATAICLLAPAYLGRNNFGFYDTDCLNALFPFSCALFFLLFATTRNCWRYLFLLAGMLTTLLFFWWWDQALAPPMVLALGPLILALLFFYRPAKGEGLLFFTAAILCCIAGIATIGLENLAEIPKIALGIFFHISKQSPIPYPDMGSGIAEQEALPWKSFASGTFAFSALFPCALLGLALLVYRARKEALLLLPIVLVALFTFLFARRFVIFAVPVFSLGIGIFFAELYGISCKSGKRWLIHGCGTAILLLMLAISWKNFQNTPDPLPIFSQPSLAGMKTLQQTEENAVVWSWWDQGHPLVYWGERDTVNDGMVHDSERTYCTAVPLVAQNDRFAANFMNFYVARGKAGRQEFLRLAAAEGLNGEEALQQMLTVGPQQAASLYPKISTENSAAMCRLLFPKQQRPIYLFLDIRQTNMLWIHFFGTWNVGKRQWQKVLPMMRFFLPEKEREKLLQGNLPNGKDLRIDKETLLLHLPSLSSEPIALSELVITDGKESKITRPAEEVVSRQYNFQEDVIASDRRHYFTNSGRFSFDINLHTGQMLLRDRNLAEGLSNRLFWRHGEYDARYFVPVELHQPFYQVWRVESDMAETL